MVTNKLLLMQEQSRQRRKKERKKIKRFNPTCYLHIDKFIEKLEAFVERDTPKTDFTKIDRFIKKKELPQKELPLPKRHKEHPVVADKKIELIRPAAVYSNTSPYGIADELHRKAG